MSDKAIEILLYLPYNDKSLSENEIRWINQFRVLIDASIKQVLRKEAQIENNIENPDINDFSKYHIIFQLFLNDSFEINNCLQKLVNKKLNIIQILGDIDNSGEIIKNLNANKNYDFYNSFISRGDFLNIKDLKNQTWLKLLDITYEIKKSLDKQTINDRKTIYIAETSDDQKNIRDSLKREFKHLGFTIVPEDELTDNMIEYSEIVHHLIAESILSIHIIGNNYAPLLKNVEISKIEIQNDIFNEVIASNENIKRYVWIPPNLKAKSEKQRKYIENFKQNIELLKKTEIIQTPVESFKNILRKELDVDQVTIEEEQENKNIAYLIFSKDDINKAEEIKKELEKKNIETIYLSNNSNSIELYKQHKKNLIKSDIVIIVYSSENEQWLNSKIKDIIKAPGFGKTNKFKLKVVMMDAKKQPGSILELEDLNIVDVHNKKTSESLNSLLEKL